MGRVALITLTPFDVCISQPTDRRYYSYKVLENVGNFCVFNRNYASFIHPYYLSFLSHFSKNFPIHTVTVFQSNINRYEMTRLNIGKTLQMKLKYDRQQNFELKNGRMPLCVHFDVA